MHSLECPYRAHIFTPRFFFMNPDMCMENCIRTFLYPFCLYIRPFVRMDHGSTTIRITLRTKSLPLIFFFFFHLDVHHNSEEKIWCYLHFMTLKELLSLLNISCRLLVYCVSTIPCTNHEKKDPNTHTHTPEVVSAISLTKTTARNEADPGVLQKFHAVEHVWSLTLRLYLHTHTTSHEPSQLDQAEYIKNMWHKPTLASLMARSGMVIRGKEYMAPCTGLQLMPGTVFRISSVSLAFSAKALRTAVRSYTRQRKRNEKRKAGILASMVNWIIHS